MASFKDFLIDIKNNAYGLGENAASLLTGAIAQPVSGYAAMFDPVHGAEAIKQGMTYAPRTEAGKMYQQVAARTLGEAVKPVMPVIDTWQQGVDIAGRYSPTFGAMLKTTPTALGVVFGAKPAMQTGRQISNSLGAMQARMVANANAPRTLNTGFRGQRGAIGTQRPLTEFEQAHLLAQQRAALPVSQGGLGLAPDNTAMDRARAMGFDVDNPVYHGTGADIKEFRNDFLGGNTGAPSAKQGHFFAETPHTASQYARSAAPINPEDTAIMNSITQRHIDSFNKIKELPQDFQIKSIEDLLDRKRLLSEEKRKIIEGKKGNWLNNQEKEQIKRIEAIEYQWDSVFQNAHDYHKLYLNERYGDEFREMTPRDGSQVYPIVLNKKNALIKDFGGKLTRDEPFSSLMKKASDGGYDSVEFKNTYDPGDIDIKRTPENIYAIFDPKNIRSRFAAFDPFNRDSSNLLAQSAKLAPAATLGAYMANEKRKDKRN